MENCSATAVLEEQKQKGGLGGWPAVVSIAAAAFCLVTTEFLPIGLLSRLANDLSVSEGVAGLSVTAPGLVAALVAPLITIFSGKTDRRVIILWLTLVVVASNLIATLAPNFAVFLAGRLLLGLAVGGLWSFAVAVGRRLVSESAGARATSVIPQKAVFSRVSRSMTGQEF